jgi:hypothetical protein
MTGKAKLAHDEHIERKAKMRGDTSSDGNPATREPEHNSVWDVAESRSDQISKDLPGIGSVTELLHGSIVPPKG